MCVGEHIYRPSLLSDPELIINKLDDLLSGTVLYKSAGKCNWKSMLLKNEQFGDS